MMNRISKTLVLVVATIGLSAVGQESDQSQSPPPPPPSDWALVPKDQGSEEYKAWERLWDTKQYPVPVTSIYWDHTPLYGFAVRRLLFDRTSQDFYLRLLLSPSFSPERLFSLYQKDDGEFWVQRVAPTKSMIWPIARDARSLNSVWEFDFGIEISEDRIDKVLAYELIGLWSEMLERVSYQTNNAPMMVMDGVSYYYAARRSSRGGIVEGESSNPRSDSIVARATRVGRMVLSGSDESSEVDSMLKEIRDLRKEIRLTSSGRD